MPADDGGIDLYVTTQWLHVDRLQIAPCLGLPEEKVRIHLAGVGGAFGSREDLHVQIHACMLALRTGRPVKMTYGREESFSGHVHRHPSRVWIRHGATRTGELVCVRARVLIDGGAYSSSSPAVIGNATTFAAGPYEVPNALLEGTAVYTNNPPCGAMRGFGAPQVTFAFEAQMDKLADVLGIDPLELRRRNALRTGSVMPTGQVLHGSAPVREVIDACASIPMPPPIDPTDRDPVTLPGGAGNVGHGEGLRRGVGIALGFKNIGYSEGFDDFHQARVSLSRGPDGPVAEVRTAAVEVGQGLGAVMTQVVRSELGIEHVVLHTADTDARFGGIDVGVSADVDGERSPPAGLPGSARGAWSARRGDRRRRDHDDRGRVRVSGRTSRRRCRGPAGRARRRRPGRSATGRPRRWTRRARAICTRCSRSPRCAPWWTSTGNSGWCASCTWPRPSTWAPRSTRSSSKARARGAPRWGSGSP